jgi:glycosyltransferase involved in cell wall biosynthesis
VIQGKPDNVLMIFAKRQIASLHKAGVVCKTFFLTSRTSPSILVKEWLKFRREIKLFKPDLIHAHYGSMTSFFCISATNVPVVVSYRGSDLNPDVNASAIRSALGKLLSQLSALRAKQIICVSAGLKARLWWKKNHATVIPSGLDLTIFCPRPRNEARSELGWGNEDCVVLFNAGRDQTNKRLDLAQSAVDVARTACGGIKFIVLNGHVEPKEIPTYLNAADCLILTSNSEGSPNVVKEALACNLPVVTVDVGDVRERLAGIRPSRIVERDPQALGQALAKILSEGKRSNGFEAVQGLSLDRLSTHILSVYESAIKYQ